MLVGWAELSGDAQTVGAQSYFGRVDMVQDDGAADADLHTSLTVPVGGTFDIEWEVGEFPDGDGLSDVVMFVDYPAQVSPTTATMTVNTAWYRSSQGPGGPAICSVNDTSSGGADRLEAACHLPGGSTDSLAEGRHWLFQVSFTCDSAVTNGAFDTTGETAMALFASGEIAATLGDGTITCAGDPVGGIAGLPPSALDGAADGPGSSARSYVVLPGAAAGILLLAAGVWAARRRWQG